MIRTTTWARRRRHGTATAVIVVLLSSALIATDTTTTGAATPPAELVSVIADFGESKAPSISADGALVGFNFDNFIFEGSLALAHVRDRPAQNTENVPFTSTPGPQQVDAVLSRDGCHVAYITAVFAGGTGVPTQSVIGVNRCAGTPAKYLFTTTLDAAVGVTLGETAISAHGRYVAFDNGASVTRVDRDPDGNGVLDEGNPPLPSVTTPIPAAHPSLGDESITNKVAIEGTGTSQVYLWDPTRTPQSAADPLVLAPMSTTDGSASTLGNGQSNAPSMSPDGRFVAFSSYSTNLTGAAVPSPSQIYLRDVAGIHTALVSKNAAGNGGNGYSITPSISADGSQIAFASTATDLLAPGGGVYDDPPLASLDLLVGRSTSGFYGTVAFDRVSLKPNGDAVNPADISSANRQEQPVISSNGRWVAFASRFNAELQTGGSSSTPPIDTDEKVYVIGRPTSVTVSPLDFGSVQVNTATGSVAATVTNTGISSFSPASITATSDYTVVGGGSCAANTWLSPGQSCTVAVTFKPTTAGTRPGTLTLAETGFAAITATGTLTGNGVPAPVVTTTSPTTVPPTTATTVPKTTTTTIPKVKTTAALTITPNPGSFGTSTIGLTSDSIDFVVTSTGTRSAPITAVIIDGANNTEFTITTDTCTGSNLPPGAGCDILVVFTPTAVGTRTANLNAGSAAATATATLDGTGLDEPTLRLLPNVVKLGEVTIAVGAGFPANLPVQLQWTAYPTVFNGTTDNSGNLTVQVPVRSDEQLGPRTLTAIDQPPLFTNVTTPGLIVEPTMHPPTSQNPALPNFPSLIVRG